MLYQTIFRSALALHFTRSSARSSATMIKPQNFTLDRSIFNQDLYSRMRDFWFHGLPPNARVANQETVKRWFGVGGSEEDKSVFDDRCRSNFGHALESIGPEKLALPPLETPEGDIDRASTIAAPLLAEVKQAQAQDGKQGSDTLLALILILDQMPRNIYRDHAGLKKVYTHYDRLAFSLLHSAMTLSPNPLEHPSYHLRPVIKNWFLLPLMHSEHLPSHELSLSMIDADLAEMEAAGDAEAVEYGKKQVEFGERHAEIIRRFGRYPYRNEFVGRKNTREEEEWLKDAETFGVKTSKGEKKAEVKSEL